MISPHRSSIVAAALVALCLLVFPVPSDVAAQPAPGSSPPPAGEQTPPPDGQAPAAPAPPAVPEDFNSPNATMKTFLRTVNIKDKTEADIARLRRCFDLPEGITERANERVADLLDVMRRLGEYENWYLPDAAELALATPPIDSATYFPHPRFDGIVAGVAPEGEITLVRVEQGPDRGYWKFSAATVAGIGQLRKSLSDLPEIVDSAVSAEEMNPAIWMRNRMPPSLKGGDLFGLEYWQWAMLGVFILVGLVLDHTVRFVLRIITGRAIERWRAVVDADSITRVVRPIGLVCAAFLWVWLTRLLDLPDAAYGVLITAATVFAVLAGTWAAWRLVDLLAEILTYKASKTATKFDDVLIPLFKRTFKVFIVAFGLVAGAYSLNVDVLPLLTGLGIGGLAFAFAAKDTIENFFGSVAVILDRPFEIGDWIVIGDVEGTVETVGFRSTRVRTFYNSQVTVPNANLVRANVDNYGRRKYRRWKTHIGVQYDTSPDQLLAFTEGIRELVRCHPFTRKDYFQVWVHQFGPSSIDILVYVFFEAADWSIELRERERLMVDMVRLADQLGVSYAFPTRTVHLYKEEHAAHEVQHDAPQSMTDRRAAVRGIRAAQQLVAGQSWQKEKPGPVPYPAGPTVIDPDDEEQAAIENRTDGA